MQNHQLNRHARYAKQGDMRPEVMLHRAQTVCLVSIVTDLINDPAQRNVDGVPLESMPVSRGQRHVNLALLGSLQMTQRRRPALIVHLVVHKHDQRVPCAIHADPADFHNSLALYCVIFVQQESM
jgi:hypothetical protein